jgi:hypothetical protein
MEIGGEQAIARVDEDFDQPCSVISQNDDLIATLPNAREAYRVARFAIRPEGGFGSVTVEKATTDECTHQSFDDWF